MIAAAGHPKGVVFVPFGVSENGSPHGNRSARAVRLATIEGMWRRRRTLTALALTFAIAAALATGAGASGHTTATVYEAFSYHGVVEPSVTSAAGSCFTSSDVTRRDDAWRCTVGNTLYDPCFSSALAFGVVVCPIPWQGSGTEIHLTKPLPKTSSNTIPSLSLQPWALETVSGSFCLLSSGASSVVHGQRLNYFCGKNAKQGLWGFPSRKTQPWTIQIAPLNAKTLKHRIALLRAWM